MLATLLPPPFHCALAMLVCRSPLRLRRSGTPESVLRRQSLRSFRLDLAAAAVCPGWATSISRCSLTSRVSERLFLGFPTAAGSGDGASPPLIDRMLGHPLHTWVCNQWRLPPHSRHVCVGAHAVSNASARQICDANICLFPCSICFAHFRYAANQSTCSFLYSHIFALSTGCNLALFYNICLLTYKEYKNEQ